MLRHAEALRAMLPRVFAADVKERPNTQELLAALEGAGSACVPASASVPENVPEHASGVTSKILLSLSRAFEASGNLESAAEICAEWLLGRRAGGTSQNEGGDDTDDAARDAALQRLVALFQQREPGILKVDLSQEYAYRSHWRSMEVAELHETFVALAGGDGGAVETLDLHQGGFEGEFREKHS